MIATHDIAQEKVQPVVFSASQFPMRNRRKSRPLATSTSSTASEVLDLPSSSTSMCLGEDDADIEQTRAVAPATLLRADPFVACEEDLPVPIDTNVAEPLTLLDPDAEILDWFRP